MVTTDGHAVFTWKSADSRHPALCRATYGTSEGQDKGQYWAYALIPSTELIIAERDASYLGTLMPLTPDKSFAINYERPYRGSQRRFAGTGFVQADAIVLGGKPRPVWIINLKSVGPADATSVAPVAAASMTGSARLVIDRETNALLGVDINPVGSLAGLSPTHWKAVSITVP
jgi:hypothetical protein